MICRRFREYIVDRYIILSQSSGSCTLYYQPTSDVVELMVALSKESTFVTNLREFLSCTSKAERADLMNVERLDDIEIRDVSYTYKNDDHPTLQSINMSIRKGEKIAIVGHNGAGKTTFVKLLMGLYSATQGEIRISGENILNYEPKSYYRHFGTVFQDLQVFALPLSHNVLMRVPQNDEERRLVEEALCKAQFGDKLATLDQGIDTDLTKEFADSGTNLPLR